MIVQPVVELMDRFTALACTDPPPRRLLLGPRHILPVLQLDLASSLVEVTQRGAGHPPEHVVGNCPVAEHDKHQIGLHAFKCCNYSPCLRQQLCEVAKVAGLVHDDTLGVLDLEQVLGQDVVDVVQPGRGAGNEISNVTMKIQNGSPI